MVWERRRWEVARSDLPPQLRGDHLALWLMAMVPLAKGEDEDSLLVENLWEQQVDLEVVMQDEEEAVDQIGGKTLEATVDSKLPRHDAPSEGGSSPLQPRFSSFLFFHHLVPQDMFLFPPPPVFPSVQKTFHQSFGQSRLS